MADQSVGSDDVRAVLGIGPAEAPPRRVLRHWKWLAGAVAALALVVLWLGRGTTDGGDVEYQTAAATRGTLVVRVTATGNLEPTNQVDVGSEVSGRLAAVNVDDNDRVSRGQVLAVIDTSILSAQVVAAEAALEAAEARVLEAAATVAESMHEWQRLKEVHRSSEGRFLSQSDLDAADAAVKRSEAGLAAARANVSESRATLAQYRSNLDKATIRSPVDGIVLSRKVDPGQTVAASFEAPVLFVLAEDLRTMELHVDVDEADVGQVREGQSASFTVDAYPGRAFPAQVLRVRYGAQEVEGVVTYETTLGVDNSDLSLRPGMTATADIVVREVRDALLVPLAALRFAPPAAPAARESGGTLLGRLFPRPHHARESRRTDTVAGHRIWVLEQGQPAPLQVTLLASDGITAAVGADGLEPGRAVITDSFIAPP
jgi:HlyD family secretion protein